MKKPKIDWCSQFQPGLDPRQWILGYGLDMAQNNGINEQLMLDVGADISEHHINEVKKIMFVNQGWRLTRVGLALFTKVYNSYNSQHLDNRILTGRVMLSMDSAVNGPWGYQNETIIVFDPMIHFELSMVEGSARQFISFKNTG